MKIILTIVTPSIASHCIELMANQAAYAKARGYEHRIVSEIHWTNLHPSFSKVWEIHQALEQGYEKIIWADADIGFMEQSIDLGDLLTLGYFMAEYQQQNWLAWKYLCAGLSVWRNCPEAKSFVDEWKECVELGSPSIEPGKRVIVNYKPWEQYYQDQMIRDRAYSGIRPCTAAEIGCFAPEIWHDGTIWQPRYPTVHLAGDRSWETVERVYREVYAKQVRI